MTAVIVISLTANVCLMSLVAHLVNQSRQLARRKKSETDRLRGSVRQLMLAYEDLDRGFAEYRKAADQAAFAQRSRHYMQEAIGN